MKIDKIEALLKRIQASLPENSQFALVVILPANSQGESEGYTVDWGMGQEDRKFAAEVLTHGDHLAHRTATTH